MLIPPYVYLVIPHVTDSVQGLLSLNNRVRKHMKAPF